MSSTESKNTQKNTQIFTWFGIVSADMLTCAIAAADIDIDHRHVVSLICQLLLLLICTQNEQTSCATPLGTLCGQAICFMSSKCLQEKNIAEG